MLCVKLILNCSPPGEPATVTLVIIDGKLERIQLIGPRLRPQQYGPRLGLKIFTDLTKTKSWFGGIKECVRVCVVCVLWFVLYSLRCRPFYVLTF